MTDIVDRKRRSELMAGIRSRNTTPELTVRRIAHRMGLRFRLHRTDLPGSPDLVFPKHRLVVFVHGCFWHRHEGCRYASTPKSRMTFWMEKFAANVARDARQEAALRARGWRTLVIWQCETKDQALVVRKLTASIAREGDTDERKNIPSTAPVKNQVSISVSDSQERSLSVPERSNAGSRTVCALVPRTGART